MKTKKTIYDLMRQSLRQLPAYPLVLIQPLIRKTAESASEWKEKHVPARCASSLPGKPSLDLGESIRSAHARS